MAKGATHEKRVRQNKHSEVVTVAAINAATTNLPGLAINRLSKFYAQIFARWCLRPSGARKIRSMTTGTVSSSMCLDPGISSGTWVLEFQQMELSPLRWSGETTRAALEAQTRDIASKMIKVGGKNDVFVVDTMVWVSTATLTIGAPRPRTVFDCGRV